MQQFAYGVLFVIFIIIGSALGANLLFDVLQGSKECDTNKDCGKHSYCGSDFTCHAFPNPLPTDYTTPALILAIGIILAMWIYKR